MSHSSAAVLKDKKLAEHERLLRVGELLDHSTAMNRITQSGEVANLIAEKTSDAFVCVDLENRITYWNHGAEQMLGWRKEEIIGKTLDLIVPARHRAGHNAGMARMRAGEPSRLAGKIIEVQSTHRSGVELPTELSLNALPAGINGEVSGFVAILRDVTDRKALQAERDVAFTALSEQMAAIEASQDGIAIADGAGAFTFINQSYASMFGYSDKRALIGLPFLALHNDVQAKCQLDEALRTIAIDSSWQGQVTGKRSDGTPVIQELTLSRLDSGAMLCVSRDIGQRSAVDSEMARLREQLIVAERLHVMAQTASGLAHDFNNLILAISASAALLDAASDPETQRHITRIRNAAEAATKLATKLLQPQKRSSERKNVSFTAAIKKAVQLVRLSLPSRGMLTVDLPPYPVTGLADSTELVQVVLNLVLNARYAIADRDDGRIDVVLRKGMPGDTSASLSQGCMPDGEWALLRVKDNGSGISSDQMGRIFDQFYTTKGEKGSGLGLSLVNNIVIQAGGGIAVTSDLGNTQFDIYWPIRQIKSENKILLSKEKINCQIISGIQILIVDDEPEYLSLMSSLLEDAGAEVEYCSHAEDAIFAIKQKSAAFSVLITDYDMPDMNGSQLASVVRVINPRLPIVLCSAMSKSIRNNQAVAKKFDAIIKKDLDIDYFIRTILETIKNNDYRGRNENSDS